MNKVALTGRITRDLELRYTTNNKAVCSFTIAVNERATEDVDFIDCEVWGKIAENLCNYQGKGSLIGVIGRIKKRDYEKDGNKVYRTYVVADEIDFLSKSPDKAGSNEQKPDEVNPFEDFAQEISIDENDLPF